MQKKFLLLEISAFELVAVNSPDSNHNSCKKAVIVLTNCPKTSDLTRTNLFLLVLPQINGIVV